MAGLIEESPTTSDHFDIVFTDAEVKEDLWAWNDFQDSLWAQEKQQASNPLSAPTINKSENE